jgi:hypothetical protein
MNSLDNVGAAGVYVRAMRTMLLAALLLVFAIASAHADTCTGAKLKAIGKKEAGLLVCQAKVAARNDTSGLTACETKVREKFTAAYGKAGACPGDQTLCESVADTCESSVAGAFIDTFPSKCETAKRTAAAKLAKRELGCYWTAAAKGGPVDTVTCIPNARGRFSAALTKAGTCPDGGSPQMLVEDKCVKAVVATETGGGNVTVDCFPRCTVEGGPCGNCGSNGTCVATCAYPNILECVDAPASILASCSTDADCPAQNPICSSCGFLEASSCDKPCP